MQEIRKYVGFMSDDKLLSAIGKLYRAYERAFAEKSLKELNKNIIDPFKFRFDTEFLYDGNPEKALQGEVFRQNDKSIANAIGVFQQQLLGSIDGFEESPSLPCDVRKLDNTIFAEVKNKHNTMNVRSAAGVYDELAGFAKSYPGSMCYLVEIVAKRSTDAVWSVTINQTVQQNKRIHLISADRFYSLATGKEMALKELCDALPDAIRDFLERERGDEGFVASKTKMAAYRELCEQAGQYGVGAVEQIYRMAFRDYIGFR